MDFTLIVYLTPTILIVHQLIRDNLKNNEKSCKTMHGHSDLGHHRIWSMVTFYALLSLIFPCNSLQTRDKQMTPDLYTVTPFAISGGTVLNFVLQYCTKICNSLFLLIKLQMEEQMKQDSLFSGYCLLFCLHHQLYPKNYVSIVSLVKICKFIR